MRVRTLKQLAKLINDLDDGYIATVEQRTSSTDTKVAGTRMRREGRGRKGLKLRVFDPKKQQVFSHDTSQCYRTVEEAIVKAMEVFGDKLNVDPDEILEVGDEVRTSEDSWNSFGTVQKVIMRGRSKIRVRRYEILLSRHQTLHSFDSRKVHKL